MSGSSRAKHAQIFGAAETDAHLDCAEKCKKLEGCKFFTINSATIGETDCTLFTEDCDTDNAGPKDHSDSKLYDQKNCQETPKKDEKGKKGRNFILGGRNSIESFNEILS